MNCGKKVLKAERGGTEISGLRFEGNESLAPEAFFLALEDFIDRARRHLQQTRNPASRAELRRFYQETIEQALRLKLEKLSQNI